MKGKITMSPECTAAAVTETLAYVGFYMAAHGGDDGYYAADLPLSTPRVGIYFQPAREEFPLRETVMHYLSEAGYQAEPVAEPAGEYLVAWTEGNF